MNTVYIECSPTTGLCFATKDSWQNTTPHKDVFFMCPREKCIAVQRALEIMGTKEGKSKLDYVIEDKAVAIKQYEELKK